MKNLFVLPFVDHHDAGQVGASKQAVNRLAMICAGVDDGDHVVIQCLACPFILLETLDRNRVRLGHLLAGACSASNLAGKPEPDCLDRVLREIEASVSLNPVSAMTHSQAARFLIDNWALFDAEGRVDIAIVTGALGKRLSCIRGGLRNPWQAGWL